MVYKERQKQLENAPTKRKSTKGNQPEEPTYPSYPTLVHIPAVFHGGEPALQRYFQKHIIYPDSATVSDVQGTIKVGFTIDRYGSVKNVKLIKGINRFADAAVVRAVEKMPLWIAAEQNGSRVSKYKEVTVFFAMSGVDTMRF